MTPTRQQIRQLRKANEAWPEQLWPVPSHEWPQNYLLADDGPARIAVWRSRDFLVQVFDEGNGVTRLSINRTDWDEKAGRFSDKITWDDLQGLKAEAGFPDHMAVEIFPPECDLVNVANLRHLWILPEPLPFAWRAPEK